MSSIFPKDFFFDSRKLFVFGFLFSIALMLLGVMDYEYLSFHYWYLVILLLSQLPLFFLGSLNVKLRIQLPDNVAWCFLGLAVLLVLFNIYINGLPNILGNFLGGDALNQATGEYYHQKIKLTALLWPLLTLLIPMSLLVRSRRLKYLLVAWPVLCSVLIQIKSPFLFGLIYFATIYQLTGRKVKASSVLVLLFMVCLLFVAVNATRTSYELDFVAEIMGLTPEYQRLNPLIWFPLSYLGGPLANGLYLLGSQAFNLNLSPYVLVLPEALLREEAREAFFIHTDKSILWPDTNNAISAIGSFSHIYGLAGLALFIFVVSLFLFVLAKNKFFGSAVFLAIFLLFNKCIALFPVGNYFVDPSFLGELILFVIVLALSKISYEGKRKRRNCK